MSIAMWILVTVGIAFRIALIIISVMPSAFDAVDDRSDEADDIYPARLLHDADTSSS